MLIVPVLWDVVFSPTEDWPAASFWDILLELAYTQKHGAWKVLCIWLEVAIPPSKKALANVWVPTSPHWTRLNTIVSGGCLFRSSDGISLFSLFPFLDFWRAFQYIYWPFRVCLLGIAYLYPFIPIRVFFFSLSIL